MNFFYVKKILFRCSLKCAIDLDKAISNKFFIKVLNYPKRKKHPVLNAESSGILNVIFLFIN